MPHPERVQLGADAETLLRAHPAVLRPLYSLGVGMVGEQPHGTTFVRLVGVGKVVVRRAHGSTRLARTVRSVTRPCEGAATGEVRPHLRVEPHRELRFCFWVCFLRASQYLFIRSATATLLRQAGERGSIAFNPGSGAFAA